MASAAAAEPSRQASGQDDEEIKPVRPPLRHPNRCVDLGGGPAHGVAAVALVVGVGVGVGVERCTSHRTRSRRA